MDVQIHHLTQHYAKNVKHAQAAVVEEKNAQHPSQWEQNYAMWKKGENVEEKETENPHFCS